MKQSFMCAAVFILATVCSCSPSKDRVIGVWEAAAEDHNGDLEQVLVLNADDTYSFANRYLGFDKLSYQQTGKFLVADGYIDFSPPAEPSDLSYFVGERREYRLNGTQLVFRARADKGWEQKDIVWRRWGPATGKESAAEILTRAGTDARRAYDANISRQIQMRQAYVPQTEGLLVTGAEWIENMDDTTEIPAKIVGWSRDGKLAYKQVWSNPFAPASGDSFIIIDTAADKTVFEGGTTDRSSNGDTPEAENAKARADFEAALKQYGIVEEENPTIFSFPMPVDHVPIRVDGRPVAEEVLCRIKTDFDARELAEQGSGTGSNWNYTITVYSKSYKKEITQGRDEFVYYKRIVGYLASPFEPRIAVIVQTYHWGLEKENYSVYRFIGCHMDTGFEKQTE